MNNKEICVVSDHRNKILRSYSNVSKAQEFALDTSVRTKEEIYLSTYTSERNRICVNKSTIREGELRGREIKYISLEDAVAVFKLINKRDI